MGDNDITVFCSAFLTDVENQADGVYGRGPGSLSVEDAVAFWARMDEDPLAASSYMTVVLAWLLGALTGMDSKFTLKELVDKIAIDAEFADVPKKGDLGAKKLRLFDSLVNTLHFMSMFVEYDVNAPFFQKAVRAFQGYRPAGREVVDMVVGRLAAFEPESGICLSLVEQCSSLHCSSGLGAVDAEPALDKPPSELTPCLMSTVLNGLLESDYDMDGIFENVLLFLKHPGITEGRLVSLFCMVRQFVASSPRALSPELLMNLLGTLKQYYLWQLPYGREAQRLMRDLSRELRCPGALWRDRFDALNQSKLGASEAGRCEGEYHVIFNSLDENGLLFRTLIERYSTETAGVCQLQYNYIVKVMGLLLDDGMDPEALGLSTCEPAVIAQLYADLVEVVGEAEAMADIAESHALVRERVTALRDSIADAPPAIYGGDEGPLQTAINRPSSLALRFWQITDTSNVPTEHTDTEHEFPRTGATQVLGDILHGVAEARAASAADGAGESVVRVAVAGGDQTLLNVVAAYVSLLHTSPDLFADVSLQLFVIPCGRENKLAQFLGYFDGWYGRHMLMLTQTVARCLPHAIGQAEDPPLASLSGDALDISMFRGGVRGSDECGRLPIACRVPGTVLRDEVERYLTSDAASLPVMLYVCELWLASATKGGDPQHITLPFCQRVELGIDAAARVTRIKKGWDMMTLDEVRAAKQFKYSAIDLSMSFTEVSLSGLSRPGPTVSSKSYWTLAISNVGAPGDAGCVPHPSQPHLEMYALDFDTGKRLQKGKSVVMDGECTYHVGVVDVQAKDAKKKFPVVVDGHVFEQVEKIKISPAKHPDTDAPLSLPIMTYVPLDI